MSTNMPSLMEVEASVKFDARYVVACCHFHCLDVDAGNQR
jgi:hypothetical protein